MNAGLRIRFGGQVLDSGLRFRFLMPVRVSCLGFRFWIQVWDLFWDLGLGYRIGIQLLYSGEQFRVKIQVSD